MTLYAALAILARVHTADDAGMGFVVRMGALPSLVDCANWEYVSAWETVRKHLGLRVEPDIYSIGSDGTAVR